MGYLMSLICLMWILIGYSFIKICRVTILCSIAYKIWGDKIFLYKNQRLNNTMILNYGNDGGSG